MSGRCASEHRFCLKGRVHIGWLLLRHQSFPQIAVLRKDLLQHSELPGPLGDRWGQIAPSYPGTDPYLGTDLHNVDFAQKHLKRLINEETVQTVTHRNTAPPALPVPSLINPSGLSRFPASPKAPAPGGQQSLQDQWKWKLMGGLSAAPSISCSSLTGTHRNCWRIPLWSDLLLQRYFLNDPAFLWIRKILIHNLLRWESIKLVHLKVVVKHHQIIFLCEKKRRPCFAEEINYVTVHAFIVQIYSFYKNT